MGERLYARCFTVSRGTWKAAIVSVEMLTVPDSLYREVKARIPAGVGLFLTATHTHSAPDSQLLNDRMTFSIPGVASYRHRWLNWYADKISGAVKKALGDRGRICSMLNVTQFKADLNRGRRPGADPEKIGTSLECGPVPLFVSYPAHPVFYDSNYNETNGDWPGKLSSLFEAEGLVSVAVLAGAIGDVSPVGEGHTAREKVDDFCAKLLAASRKGTVVPVWKPKDPALEIEQPIQMDPAVPSPGFLSDYKVPEELANTMVSRFAPDHASITAIRFGRFALIGVPGEPTSHLGRRIREAGLKMGFVSVLVVSHVNGWIGYILDPLDYSHGGYEASLSFNGPQEGEHVVAAAVLALQRLQAMR